MENKPIVVYENKFIIQKKKFFKKNKNKNNKNFKISFEELQILEIEQLIHNCFHKKQKIERGE